MNLVYVSNQLNAGQVPIVFNSMQSLRQSSCGVPDLVADINFLMNRCWWVVGTLSVESVNSVRDLGVYLDTDVSMGTHISKLVSSCFGILRQIRCIRRSLTRSSLSTVITAFILPKVDYCNVVLSGLPKSDIDRLSSVRH